MPSALPSVLCAGLLLGAVALLPPGAGGPQPDDFMFPRELLLCLTALAAALLCLAHGAPARPRAEDVLLAAFTALGVLSYLASANRWLGARALGVTTAAAVVFWCARSLAGDGGERAVLRAAAAGAVALAATALAEAYGGLRLSLPGRAPGGALGHRNSTAHLLVLALPVLFLLAARARTAWGRWAVSAGVAAAAAVVVLSRSRGAWLAALAVGALALGLAALHRRRHRHATGRPRSSPGIRAALAGLALGVAAAVALPNRLGWAPGASEAETLQRIADYAGGSGRGRLIQYARTWPMVADHPVLGVGPGNWMVQYPRYAAPGGDPSYHPRDLVPTNRLPQGDWVGLAAERGLPALLLLLGFGVLLAARAARILRPPSRNPASGPSTRVGESVDAGYGLEPVDGGAQMGRAEAAALLCTLAALGVLGLFDPILLQPLHAFYAFTILGALAPPSPPLRRVPALGTPARLALACALVVALAPPLAVGTRQLRSAMLLRGRPSPAALAAAVRASPGDYRLQALLAGYWVARGRCELARGHIRSALALFPTAPAAQDMQRRCAAEAARPPVSLD